MPGTGLGTLHTQTRHFTEFKGERLTEGEALDLVSPAEPLIILTETGNQEDFISTIPLCCMTLGK